MKDFPPMPSSATAVQEAYARMLSVTYDAVIGSRLTPQTALLLAFIGEQCLSAVELRRNCYWIGTNVSHSLKILEAEGLIEDQPCFDRRRRMIRLSPKGILIAKRVRQWLASRFEGVSQCNGLKSEVKRSDDASPHGRMPA